MADQGDIIGGKYEILKEIGRGGMSVVYLAMDKNLNKQWAVKEVRRDSSIEDNQVIIKSFLTEANLMKKLDHPTLPRIVDIIDKGQSIYVIMDYIEGEPLDKVLRQHGAQKQELIIEWGKQLCDVLDYLHTRVPPVIYRDMKPSNVMLRPDGSVKLIDFGIAREYKDANIEDTISLGTRGYAAPEQFGGRGQTDARTDIYCLGATLYHLVTGKNPCEPPYELYPIRHWNSALSSGLEWIIQKCTQLNPSDRFQSCAEVLYALHNAEKYEGKYKSKQKKKVNAFIISLVMCALFLCVGILGTVMSANAENEDYETKLDQESTEGYKEAISIDPSRAEAYDKWVNMYMQNQSGDGEVEKKSFTIEESNILKGAFDKNHLNELKKKNAEGYARVCYNAGRLYWYFYNDNGTAEDENASNEQINRMVGAIEWFEMIKKLNQEKSGQKYLSERERSTVDCYYNVGKFYMDREVAERGDTGGEKLYLNYLRDMTKLVKAIGIDRPMQEGDKKDVDVVIRAQMYELILYSLDSDIELFKNQGAEKKEVQEIYDIAADNARDMQPEREREIKMKERILDRLDTIQKKIDMAYSGKDVQ